MFSHEGQFIIEDKNPRGPEWIWHAFVIVMIVPSDKPLCLVWVGVCTEESSSCCYNSQDSAYISLTRISSFSSTPYTLLHTNSAPDLMNYVQFPEKPCAIITTPFLMLSPPLLLSLWEVMQHPAFSQTSDEVSPPVETLSYNLHHFIPAPPKSPP